MRSIVVWTLALILVAQPVTAQLIQGQVVAEGDKRALPGVRVALLGENAAVLKETTTDSTLGSFYLDAPAPGTLQLAIYDRLGNSYLSPAFAADTGAMIERKLVLPDLPASYDGLPLLAARPLRPTRGHLAVPRYPAAKRLAQRPGFVRIAVIVDENGHVVPGSEYVAASSDEDFTSAVRDVIRDLQFAPAAEAARPPLVIVNNTFTFSLLGMPKPPCGTESCIATVGYSGPTTSYTKTGGKP